MPPKAIRNAAGTVIGLELDAGDHPDGIPTMIAVVPIPEGATVGEPEDQPESMADELARLRAAQEPKAVEAPAAESTVGLPPLDETERAELDELRAARDNAKAIDHAAAGTDEKAVGDPAKQSPSSPPPWWPGGSAPAPTS